MADRTNKEEILILQTQMTGIKEDITDIKQDIKEIKDAIVPTVQENSKRIARIEKNQTFLRYIQPIIVAVATAIITFFVLGYFNSL